MTTMRWGDSRLPSRFWDKVSPEPNTGCWLWTSKTKANGVGSFNVNRRAVNPARLVFDAVTTIPEAFAVERACATVGCCNPEHMVLADKPTLRHGLSRTPEYRAWQTMRHRCTSPSSPAWADYGGRGITICAEWMHDPAAFIAHIGPKPSPKHEVDRIQNDRGYEPGNVRWARRHINTRNRRSNHIVEFNGEALTIVEWAIRLNMAPDTLGHRLAKWKNVERALTTPLMGTGPKRQTPIINGAYFKEAS